MDKQDIIDALEKSDLFPKGNNYTLQIGLENYSFDKSTAGMRLSQRAKEVGIKKAADELDQILKCEPTKIAFVTILRGIKCEENIELTKNTSIAPIDSIPETSRLNALLKDPTAAEILSWHNTMSAATIANSPTQKIDRAALISEYTVDCPLFLVSDNISSASFEMREKKYEELSYEHETARLCLLLSGKCYPQNEVRWFQYLNSPLTHWLGASSVSINPDWNISGHARAVAPIDKDDETEKLVRSFLALGPQHRQVIQTSINRVQYSSARVQTGERALEIAIALESLLLSDEKGDNKFKTSLRSALLIRTTPEERKTVRDIVEKMYDIRSDFVHKGATDKDLKIKECAGYGALTPVQIVDEARKIAIEIIITVLESPESWTTEKTYDFKALDIGAQLKKPLN